MAILEDHYSLNDLLQLYRSNEDINYSTQTLRRINKSAQFLKDYLADGDKAVYGVNTGFGSLQNVRVPENELHELQRNLLITHAAGTGKWLESEIVRMMMLLKIINISKGFSAISEAVAERLLWLYNNKWTPQVHEQGSLGASGDLAPLSEMCLPLIGLGTLEHPTGGIKDAADVLTANGFEPLVLGPKEALALINGTQFMLAHAVLIYEKSTRLLNALPVIAGISTDAWLCRKDPFLPQLHVIRPHAGQMKAAAEMLSNLNQSPMQEQPRIAVQDPYSFRCIPQVHGASLDALEHCFHVWETELNSVTDNPNVFPDDNLILSGGNFHGQPLALTLDYAAMALAELGSISERRTYLLISGQRGLPPFLSPNPGTDSGYMIAQYTAASIVSRNKQLCTPASVDSIMSSNGQEDHVSMGANAAIKAMQVADHTVTILGIELLCAAQAMTFRTGKTFPHGEELLNRLKPNQEEHMQTPMWQLIGRAVELLN
jgi:histidine ammonia-lyase